MVCSSLAVLLVYFNLWRLDVFFTLSMHVKGGKNQSLAGYETTCFFYCSSTSLFACCRLSFLKENLASTS
jgi:hypothetical protein